MTAVFVYGGSGEFSGGCSFAWQSPELGATHKFILFLSQQENESVPHRAIEEVTRHGFSKIELGRGQPIAVEALNDPSMEVFRQHYEGALAHGASLVWYR